MLIMRCVKKFSFARACIICIRLRPLERLRQPRAAIERAWIALHLLPFLCRVSETARHPQIVTIFVEPFA